MQQQFDYPVSYKTVTSKISTFIKAHLPFDSPKTEINNKLFAKADSLVDKILSCPRIKLSISPTLNFIGVEIQISLSDTAQQLHRKHFDVPEIYFTLLDAAGTYPTLISNENAKTKEKRSWVFFKN